MLVVASFIGFVAAGQMLVVLVGGIDLSIPWVLNGAAIVLTTTSLGQSVADAAGHRAGARRRRGSSGFANGMGVAWLGVPAVVMTLGMNGVMQGLTLGLSKGLTCASCASYAPQPLRDLFAGRVLGIPWELFVWARRRAVHDRAADPDHVRPAGVRGRRQPAGGVPVRGRACAA